LWTLPPGPLVLASGSPRRKLLLRQQGISFRTVHTRVVEHFARGETPRQAARRLALAKARAAARRHRRAWIVAADTVVTIDGHLLAKPSSRREAESMLRRLAGRRHAVVTAVAVVGPGFARAASCRTAVSIRRLTAAEVRAYAATREPYDKAGGYALQGLGAVLVERIEGDWSNVVGLPLGLLRGLLAEAADRSPR
jgi:septum formation protein